MKINIVILTGSNPYNNAGIYAFDMFKSFKLNGCKVKIITKYYDKRFENGVESIYGYFFTKLLNYYDRIINKLSFRKVQNEYFMHSLNERKNYIKTSKILKLIDFEPDLIIYLFPHGFLNAKNLLEINHFFNKPICIAPVDLGSITGGCHYTNGCKNFKVACGNCPGILSKNSTDITNKNLNFKYLYLSKTDIFCIGNEWTLDFLRESRLFKFRKLYKSNIVINENQFFPGSKELAKKHFSIEKNKIVIFFGAAYLKDKRKGIMYLINALNLLYNELDENYLELIQIAIAGNVIQNEEIKAKLKFKALLLGHLNFEELNLAFQMADVFVSASIQDAGPMMVAQSMMSGTPVVAFRMGNSLDFIEDGITGFQVELYNEKQLKEGIRNIILSSTEEKNAFQKNCRKKAMNLSSYNSFFQNFFEIVKDFKKE